MKSIQAERLTGPSIIPTCAAGGSLEAGWQGYALISVGTAGKVQAEGPLLSLLLTAMTPSLWATVLGEPAGQIQGPAGLHHRN